MTEENKTPQAATEEQLLSAPAADGQTITLTPISLEEAFKVFDGKEDNNG
jgi:hypothetical protein